MTASSESWSEKGSPSCRKAEMEEIYFDGTWVPEAWLYPHTSRNPTSVTLIYLFWLGSERWISISVLPNSDALTVTKSY